jgi:hypothetical protein
MILKKYTDTKALIGGPKIRRVFDDSLVNALSKIKPELTIAEIFQILLNHGGPRPAVFASESVFHELVNQQIERLRGPSIDCVCNNHDEMEKIIFKVVQDQQKLSRFPNLKNKIQFHLKTFLQDRLPIAKEYVDELINIELASINTNHPDFWIEQVLNIKDKDLDNGIVEKSFMNLKTERNAEILYYLIENYFPIVKKTVQDQVPKIIMYKVINYMKKNSTQNELLNNLLNENDVNLLQESEDNEHKRQNAKDMIQALQVAQLAIEEIKIQI